MLKLYKYYIIILLTIINIILSRKKIKECKTSNGKILYIIHLMLSLYLYLGWILFENNKLHLLITIIVLIHWFIFGNKCIITIITNKSCDYNFNDKFEDFLYLLNLSKYNKHYHYIIITMIIIIDIYMINK